MTITGLGLRRWRREGGKLANAHMSIACDNGKMLMSKVERHSDRYPDELKPVALAYLRTLHASVCLTLLTLTRPSVSPAAAGNAKQLVSVRPSFEPLSLKSRDLDTPCGQWQMSPHRAPEWLPNGAKWCRRAPSLVWF